MPQGPSRDHRPTPSSNTGEALRALDRKGYPMRPPVPYYPRCGCCRVRLHVSKARKRGMRCRRCFEVCRSTGACKLFTRLKRKPECVCTLEHPCDFHALATIQWLSDRGGWYQTPEGPRPPIPVAPDSQGSAVGPAGGSAYPPGEVGAEVAHSRACAPQGGAEQTGPCSVWHRFRKPYLTGRACVGKPPGWESSGCRESLSRGALRVIAGPGRSR